MPGPTLTFIDTSADETEAIAVSRSCKLRYIEVSNVVADTYFLQLFDATSTDDFTLGATTPKQSFAIPKGDGTDFGILDMYFDPNGIDFQAGIGYAVTTSATGSGAPSTAVVLNLGYE